ncbi:MAG TPA: hypothetical protein VGU23_02455, partial [Acidobacteriaceae bacterium]|nr:hypothetical protein [Acidobacteriaceae bacterium]
MPMRHGEFAAGSILLLAAISLPWAAAQKLNVTQAGSDLDIVGQVPGSIHEVDLWIESSRNTKISKMSDVSSVNPDIKTMARKNEDRDVSYPVVDVRLEPGMVGVVQFDTAPKVCTINGEYFKEPLQCTSTYTVLANHLLYWENTVFAEPASAAVTR